MSPMPAPGAQLREEDEVEGVIWHPKGWRDRYIKSRTGRGGKHTWDWVAQCQKCGVKWALRSKRYTNKYKMPVRCPGCMTRRWFEGPAGNSERPGTIATEPPKISLVLGEKGAGMTATAYQIGTSPSPLSEESIMASHRRFQQEDRVKELMAREDYDNKAKLVYCPTDSPPTCSVCGKDLQDDVVIQGSMTGLTYCLDHAPHLHGHQEGDEGAPVS